MYNSPIDRAKLAQAIRDMEYARKAHQDWAEYNEKDPAERDMVEMPNPTTWRIDMQRQWVQKYDAVLELLRMLEGFASCTTVTFPADSISLPAASVRARPYIPQQPHRMGEINGQQVCYDCAIGSLMSMQAQPIRLGPCGLSVEDNNSMHTLIINT